MSEHDDQPPRTGSYADLARRVDRVEQTVANLQTTIGRVELNQQHAEELTRLRFSALDNSVAGVGSTLTTFIARIEGIMSGEIQTSQTRTGAELVSDYQTWRRQVDAALPDPGEVADYRDWREKVDAFMTQGKLLGTLVKLAVLGNLIALVAGFAAFLKP